ncbi:hypothetical protein R5W23_002588 [Gemmata sp. JC673]|uniref:Uncharacterized protein n=1 Tax=Gemmata algarum TaxID=2975278 RepID=A0ABU5F614_9BACT|nr:hypothetical protein [Gemmata algarum]MDY3561311.1 hypothetical protein [Gemmata algarum]
MPIVLTLTGHLNPPERLARDEVRDWLSRAAVWFEGVGDVVLDARVVRDGEDRPVLLVLLHPAAPAAEVRLGAGGKVRVTAVTTPAGPGYHIHLCGLLRRLAAEFQFAWPLDDCTDPTNYFQSRDRERCEQAFLRWLADACAAGATSPGLPPNHGYSHPGEVLTPLGPRTRAWRDQVAAAPARGREFFPWWAPDLDPAFYRDRALVRLWCDFPWRPPLSEEEGELADQIANDLASAFKLDPGAELPWAEWLELLTAIRGDEDGYCVTPDDAGLSIELWKHLGPLPAPAKERIGYRRYAVRVQLDGGWSVEVPGELLRERNHDRTWTAWDGTRTVWFQALRFTKKDGAQPTAAETAEVGRKSLPEGEPLPPLDRDGLRGEAVFGVVEEDGRRLWRLSGVTGAPGELAVCNVYVGSETDRDWAVHTWLSLRHA